MVDRHQRIALGWVTAELDALLSEARTCLEDNKKNEAGAEGLSPCHDALRQVRGFLQMVELHSVSLMAEEMELLCAALIDGTVADIEHGREFLMQGVVELPLYLEKIKNGQIISPQTSLPLLNGLRNLRGAILFPTSQFFTLDLDPDREIRGERDPSASNDVQYESVLLKLRKMFRLAASALVKGKRDNETLSYLKLAIEKLAALTSGTPRHEVWWVAQALSEYILDNEDSVDQEAKGVLQSLDREIALLETGGVAGLDKAPKDDLLKSLLFFLMRLEPKGERLTEIHELYNLAEAAQRYTEEMESVQLNAPDTETLKTVTVAVEEEMAEIKGLLEAADTNQAMAQVAVALRRLADTLAVLGFAESRHRLTQLTEQFAVYEAEPESEAKVDRDQILSAAEQLVDIEHELYAAINSRATGKNAGQTAELYQLQQAQESVLGEVGADLQEIRNSLTDFVSEHFNRDKIQDLPEIFARLFGCMVILELIKPAQLTKACGNYLEEILSSDGEPEWEKMEALADIVSRLEYCVQLRKIGVVEEPELLEIADKSSVQLGYPSSEITVARISSDAEADDAVDVAPTDSVDEEQETELDATVTEAESSEAVEAATDTVEEPEEDEIDEEILEIFVEEAGEVLEAIDEFFPKWAADFGDSASLGEFRRAFHTLKGSGRMVGADTIGELAWAVENMLNRIIDGAISPSAQCSELISRVRALLPELIDAFENRQSAPQPDLVEHLRVCGEAISKGGSPNLEFGAEQTDTNEAATPEAAPEAVIDEVVVEEPIAEVSETVTEVVAESQADEADMSDDSTDTVLLEIFAGEAQGHLDVMREFTAHMNAAAPSYAPPTDDLQRALHTLKGSAHMAEIHGIAEMVTPLEKLVKELRAHQLSVNKDFMQLLEAYCSGISDLLAAIEQGRSDPEPDNELASRVAGVRDSVLRDAEASAGEDMDARVDPKVLAIFMAEELDLIIHADEILPEWRMAKQGPEGPGAMLEELGRLEEGAEQANLPPVAQLAAKIADIYLAADENLTILSDSDFDLLISAHEQLLDRVDLVAAGQNIPDLDADFVSALEEIVEVCSRPASDVDNADAEQTEIPVEGELSAEEVNATPIEEVAENLIPETDLEEEVVEIFLEEVDDLLEEIESAIQAWQESGSEADNELLQRALHTFKGGARMAGLNTLGEAAHDFESEAIAALRTSDAIAFDHFYKQLDRLFKGVTQLKGRTAAPGEGAVEAVVVPNEEIVASSEDVPNAEQPAVADIENATSDVSSDVGNLIPETELDEEVVEIFLDEADDLLEEIESAIQAWQESGTEEDCELLQRALHTFKGGARMAGLYTLGESAHVFESNVILASRQTEGVEFKTFFVEWDKLFQGVSQLKARQEQDAGKSEVPVAEVKDATDESTTSVPEVSNEEVVNALEDGVDPEALAIFLKEAHDIMWSMSSSIASWKREPAARSNAEQLLQELRSFKGGARLAGLMQLAHTTEQFEGAVNGLKQSSHLDKGAIDTLAEWLDTLKKSLSDIEASAPKGAEHRAATSDALHQGQAPTESNDDSFPGKPSPPVDNVLPFVPKGKPAPRGAPLPGLPGGGHYTGETGAVASNLATATAQARRSAPQEAVKVTAELLEELVNLAGETSITRSRIEEQLSEVGFAIEEMDATISRLQEQLRRLDIETQAQIVFRQEQMEVSDDFDPLEMDRYSHLQQLSRSLIESASDLTDLKITLINKKRDTETLLLQQSRINTDLQEGLMRSRMVPFSRLAPRLKRIVRQVAGELGKNIELDFANVDGEMDRTVLERMVAPMEHMLRNAIDHGIENLKQRQAAGKPETGRILISFERAGGEIVLRLRDDGRGINLEKVRQKAIDRGLMKEDADLDDHAIMQFILHAGFSTAESVTQISGRGVGMDVVSSEIKQMGGTVSIHSQQGKGTEFEIRLPFTVSVNRALMVAIGDDHYAIPLNTIEGIVRVSPFELEHYYQDPNARFEYAGESYQVRYLGSLLRSNAQPKLDSQILPLPVVLVRTSAATVAVQVDALLGSREIVVKSLGPQFGSVPGVSGATVMGDGSVVVILDPHALIRQDAATAFAAMPNLSSVEADNDEDRARVVMVVDDSVTVRKVTSRFLEREGFEVRTAKDGADAILQLQDFIPDVMLLDIEMPRMDGFEVAKTIRTSSRLKDLPIIMITSRTGDKHRDRALSLGVNDYMGKPYQEDKLLAAITSLVGTGSHESLEN